MNFLNNRDSDLPEGWVRPYSTQCGNCHASLQEGDKYCRECGTKVGEGDYAPYKEYMECLYGPCPIKRIHKCESCGYTWETVLMIDSEKYCPRCGNGAPVIKEIDFDY